MAFHPRITLLSLGMITLASSCGYDWDALEPDGTAAWGGAGGAVGGSGGTAGSGGSAGTAGTAGTGTGGTAGTGTGGTAGTGPGGTAGTGPGGTAGSAGTAATGGSGGGALACDEPNAQLWADNGHCYFLLGSSADWFTQRDACAAAGAHLVSITSQAEQDFVAPIGGGDRWIGFSKVSATEFSWITGEAVTYEHWRQGEPNESGDACARLRDNGEWADRACDNSLAAICERE